MPKDKVKGISSLTKMIIHHVGQDKLESITHLFSGEELLEEIQYRGRMLQNDLGTLNNAIEEILKIAKANQGKGYEKIKEIIEDREYKHGHNF